MFEWLNTCLGVELKMIDGNTYSCRFGLLTKKGNSLSIEQNKEVEGPLVTVLAALPKKYLIALTLTGKGILHKNIVVPAATADEQKFNAAFPGVDQKEFYSQQFSEGEHTLVSIARKQLIDELLDKLVQAGLKVYTLSLGPIVTTHVWSQLNIYSNQVQFDGHVFTLTAEKQFVGYQFDSIAKSEFPVKVEQEAIPEENILAYAAAFQLLLYQKLNPIIANITSVNSAFAYYLENAKIKTRAFVFLFSLFGVLLLNFLLFSYYNKENTTLIKKVGAQTASVDQIDVMKKNIAENEALFKQLNWNGGYNYGFLLNEIGSSMPKRLRLQEVAMNEFKTAQEKEDRTPNVKILGSTDNLSAVNNWIFVLKERNWVKTVQLLKYQEDTESSEYQFSIILTY